VSDELLLHALDSAMLGDFDRARSILANLDGAAPARVRALLTEIQKRDEARAQAQAMVRHEVGNALSVAQSNLEGIVDGVLSADEKRLSGIRDALRTAGVLLDEFQRPASKIDGESPVIHLDAFNICDLIAAQAAMIGGIAESKGVRMIYDPCSTHYEACVSYRGDPDRIGQVLRNVLINAVRYTPPGGTIEMRCDRPDGELTLIVHDSGPGIDRAEAPHIFEPRFRGRGAQLAAGEGLGLSITADLLRALGGEARVVDEAREGATFAIRLPAVAI
jgi:signal transduction histidine kinase